VSDLRGSEHAARPDIWVVAVGVSRYPHLPERMQLAAADDDARAVASKLARLAGPQGLYAAAHVRELVDAEATPEAIRRALASLATMRPNDVAVVFFAGHGLKAGAGDMVFTTSEARIVTTAAGPTVPEEGTLSWRDLSAALGRARGRVVVLLDACHSGHVTRELAVPNDLHAAALARRGAAGSIVFAAAKGRQPSFEPGSARAVELVEVGQLGALSASHGLFTAALLDALESPETDRDASGTVEVRELIEVVTERVRVATRGAQTPWVARRELFGDFALALPKR
jgi:uncharacterized caspase-like protein